MTAMFGPQGANAATQKPQGYTQQRYGNVQTWVKDSSAPGASDGTVLNSAFYNRIIGALDYLVGASGVTALPGDDSAVYRAIQQVIAGNAPGQLNTLRELADAIGDDPNYASTVLQLIGNRVQFDQPQALTSLQMYQARANIGITFGNGPNNTVQLDGNAKLPLLDGSALTNVTVTWSNVSGKPTFGTASGLNVGTGAGNVVQLDATTAKLPAVDGSLLTNVTVTWGNVSGKPTLGTASGLNVGTGAGNVVQLDATTAKLPAVDGSQLTGVVASGTASLTANNSLSGTQAITNTTDATSATAGGAMTISGGLAVAKKLYVGTAISVPAVANNVVAVGGATGSGAVYQINYLGGATGYGISLRPQTDGTTAVVFMNASGSAVGSIGVTASATTYNTTSDRRLKTDRRELDDPRRVIMKTKVWDFKWKTTGERAVGVIAQEAFRVCKAVVTRPRKRKEVWTVDYSKYVPYLIAHNQHLQRQIDALEKIVAKLNR